MLAALDPEQQYHLGTRRSATARFAVSARKQHLARTSGGCIFVKIPGTYQVSTSCTSYMYLCHFTSNILIISNITVITIAPSPSPSPLPSPSSSSSAVAAAAVVHTLAWIQPCPPATLAAPSVRGDEAVYPPKHFTTRRIVAIHWSDILICAHATISQNSAVTSDAIIVGPPA